MGVFGKNYLHTVVTDAILKLVVGLVISVVTARGLGPEGRGESQPSSSSLSRL